MDKMETELEMVKSVRLRHQTSRQPAANGPDSTPHFNYRINVRDSKRWSIESSCSMAAISEHGPFQWQMPFIIKCLGTFRWASNGVVVSVAIMGVALWMWHHSMAYMY